VSLYLVPIGAKILVGVFATAYSGPTVSPLSPPKAIDKY
jgi:hypothetical protein